MALLETTQQLLRARLDEGISVPDIVKAAKGAIGREWLYKFVNNDIENPGVNTIQSLHDCLLKIKRKSAA